MRKKNHKLICKFCNKIYYVTTYESKRSTYCSRKCHSNMRKSKRTNLICEWCGKQYSKPYSLAKISKQCSKYCHNKANAQKIPIGINHWRFKTGIGIFRRIAKECFPVKCFICSSDKYLNVHHKDSNRFNNKISNLMYVCRSCHNRIHKVIFNIKHMNKN